VIIDQYRLGVVQLSHSFSHPAICSHIRILRCGKNGERMRVDIEGEPQFQQLSQLITFYVSSSASNSSS